MSWFRRRGYTQICVVRGIVSWPGEGDGNGELQLWDRGHGKKDDYLINVIKIAEVPTDILVCESLMFCAFTSKSALTE